MNPILDAWSLVVIAMAGVMNREQGRVLEYLLAENRVLKEQLARRGGRLRFIDK